MKQRKKMKGNRIMKDRNNLITTILLALGFLALVPAVQAVSPAPDGGYPGGNTAEGQTALLSLTTGTDNTAVGLLSLRSDTGGSYNTGIGAGALFATTTGAENTATGFAALLSNMGSNNTANGAEALLNNMGGSDNTAVGYNALQSNTTGVGNTANGANALSGNTMGNFNTAIGELALEMTTGSHNVAVGANAGSNVTTANNVICIGADGNNVDNSCYIGQIFGATSSNGVGVFVNSNGRLGTTTSSRRFKEDVRPMAQASEPLLALEPVTFRYKKEIDPKGISQFGLVAEEVEKVNPDLVVRDRDGKPYSVRYDQVNAMLLNEFLKEHKTVQDLETTVARQQKGMETLTAQLKEQAAQIQKISAQLEVNKPTPRVVKNKS